MFSPSENNSLNALTNVCSSQVEFIGVKESYDLENPIVQFVYQLKHGAKSQEGDRIGLYREGWKDISDEVDCVLVQSNNDNEAVELKLRNHVISKDYSYQLCYMTGGNFLAGFSPTFRFRELTVKSLDMENSFRKNFYLEAEVLKLLTKNAELTEEIEKYKSKSSSSTLSEATLPKVNSQEIQELENKLKEMETKFTEESIKNSSLIRKCKKLRHLEEDISRLNMNIASLKSANDKIKERIILAEESKNKRDAEYNLLYRTSNEKIAELTQELANKQDGINSNRKNRLQKDKPEVNQCLQCGILKNALNRITKEKAEASMEMIQQKHANNICTRSLRDANEKINNLNLIIEEMKSARKS